METGRQKSDGFTPPDCYTFFSIQANKNSDRGKNSPKKLAALGPWVFFGSKTPFFWGIQKTCWPKNFQQLFFLHQILETNWSVLHGKSINGREQIIHHQWSKLRKQKCDWLHLPETEASKFAPEIFWPKYPKFRKEVALMHPSSNSSNLQG